MKTVGEMSRIAGVSIRTMRYYECARRRTFLEGERPESAR